MPIFKKLNPLISNNLATSIIASALWAAAVHGAWPLDVNHNGDWDADGLMDPSIYCEATGEWRALLVSTDYTPVWLYWGGPGWSAIQSDYDGDGKADFLAYNRASGEWAVLLSGSNYADTRIFFGGEGWSVVTGDFDGDGKTDPTVYRESTGEWRTLLSRLRYTQFNITFGGPDCTAVPGDYDGDNYSDPALYRRTDGQWLVRLSSRGYWTNAYFVDAMGDGPLVPVPFDYDGDRKTDPALFAYSCGSTVGKSYVFGWYVTHSSPEFRQLEPFYHLGREDCQPSNADPTPGDYDGDRMGDYAVTWPDTSEWRMWRSSRGWERDHCVDDWRATGFRPVQR